ncbi:MAG TPA: ATP-binding protein [Mycobacteriales bacterium]|nr:ATP-binding protein [Mycobacteriales bacterium]
MRRIGRGVRIAVPLAVVVGSLGGTLALQQLAGGIRPASLGPAVLALSVGAFGALIAVHRPRLGYAPLLITIGVGFAVGSLAAATLDYAAMHPIPQLASEACFAAVTMTRVFLAGWVLFILWFPDGRIPSRGWRRFFVASVALCAGVGIVVWLIGPTDRVFGFYQSTRVPPGAAGPYAGTWPAAEPVSDALLALPLLALGALVQRFRGGDAVLRQQMRWLLWGSGITVVAQITGTALVGVHGAARDVGLTLGVVTQPLPMLAATVAIMRYRLWDIDLVVSRAAVYAVLWAALSTLFLMPALAAGLLVGGHSAATAIGIALLVTVVFHPARQWLDRLAVRLAYRHRARPYVLLAGFWSTLRAADLDRIGVLVADAVRAGMHVEWAGLWLFRGSPAGGSLRALGVTGAAATEPVPVSAAMVERLLEAPALDPPPAELEPLWTLPAEAVVPLVAADELVGVLACGGRRGDRLRPADFELLEVLARECALRLRNLRLESELRERLEEIERQAAELARSRQRLVTAQDTERRRIERNLHDGVQQQLVSLTAKLHRAAADGDPHLAALAAEAEHAVFALQELGRGIYPSVLVDHGLPAALRAQAARMPVGVHLEVDEAFADHRLDRDVEAALYFVALEALTNAYKHAAGAAISVWLRAEQQSVRLEVLDTGPGLPAAPSSGSGLQNMHDRIAAVGGVLEVASSAGHGTRVMASVPTGSASSDPADQPVAADSRR